MPFINDKLIGESLINTIKINFDNLKEMSDIYDTAVSFDIYHITIDNNIDNIFDNLDITEDDINTSFIDGYNTIDNLELTEDDINSALDTSYNEVDNTTISIDNNVYWIPSINTNNIVQAFMFVAKNIDGDILLSLNQDNYYIIHISHTIHSIGIISHIEKDHSATIFFKLNQNDDTIYKSNYTYNYEYSINNSDWIPTYTYTDSQTDSHKHLNNFITINGLHNNRSYSIRIRTHINVVNIDSANEIYKIYSMESTPISIIPNNIQRTIFHYTFDTPLQESFALRMLTTKNNFSSKSHLSCNKLFISQQVEQPIPFTVLYGNPTIIFENSYYYIIFTENGIVEILSPLSADVNDFHTLVVGGGGGGGDCTPSPDFNSGGGGGAGGAVKLQNMLVSPAIYNITVGQGGQAVTPTQPFSTNGSNSIFSTVVASGGLKGSDASNTGGLGGIGNNGGGSGGNGGTKSSSVHATNGSNGTSTVINLITTYYGGGGGGGSYRFQPSSSVGGLGGGGGGGFNFRDGLPNTGGGGAGRNGDGVGNNNGGQGGSGIVIIYFKYIPIYHTVINGPVQKCFQEINKKVANSSGDVDQTLTQSQRAVNAIKYSTGGRIVYGNSGSTSNRLNFLGRTEGQPGGIIGPLRNKF